MVAVTVDWSAAKVPRMVPKVEAVEVIVASGITSAYAVMDSMTLTRRISVREMLEPLNTNLISHRPRPRCQSAVDPT
jgi:hypothetical protein